MRSKLIVLALIILSFTYNFAEEIITEEQDSQNKKFLILLNDNILTTINVLEAFNEQASEIYLIKNGEYYNAFLMDMAMQCSNLINEIRSADTISPLEREKLVRALTATIKPDVEFEIIGSDMELNIENGVYLTDVNTNLSRQLASLQKVIMNEEKIILQEGEVTQNYLRMHSHHFLFSLLLDFIEPSEYLSEINLNYLVEIVRSVDESLPKE